MHLETKYLLLESAHQTDGVGPAVALCDERGKLLVVTLSIHEVVDRYALTVSLWGSADGKEFGTRPLASFRPRHYTGIHSTLLNLAGKSHVNFLRVQWEIELHRKSNHQPMFNFQVFCEESGARLGTPAGVRSFTQSLGAPNWSRARGYAA